MSSPRKEPGRRSNLSGNRDTRSRSSATPMESGLSCSGVFRRDRKPPNLQRRQEGPASPPQVQISVFQYRIVDTHVALRMEDARTAGSPDVGPVLDRPRAQERGGDRGCDRGDDPGLVAAVARIDLSAPGGAATGRAHPEARGRAV